MGWIVQYQTAFAFYSSHQSKKKSKFSFLCGIRNDNKVIRFHCVSTISLLKNVFSIKIFARFIEMIEFFSLTKTNAAFWRFCCCFKFNCTVQTAYFTIWMKYYGSFVHRVCTFVQQRCIAHKNSAYIAFVLAIE